MVFLVYIDQESHTHFAICRPVYVRKSSVRHYAFIDYKVTYNPYGVKSLIKGRENNYTKLPP